jgi:hypothetical protein
MGGIQTVIAINFETVSDNIDEHPTGALVTDLIGARGVTGGGPTSYFVDVQEGYEIRPHFHGVDQYQVVVRGKARLGKHSMSKGDFHYADRHTPYGPIVAAEGGMAFFTLRPIAYDGFHEMPQSRHLMQKSGNRTFVKRADPNAARVAGIVELEVFDDGTTAFQLSAGPNERLALPAVDHGGAYVLVISGALRFDDIDLPELSCVWIEASDPTPRLVATDHGAVALFLSYSRTTNYGDK